MSYIVQCEMHNSETTFVGSPSVLGAASDRLPSLSASSRDRPCEPSQRRNASRASDAGGLRAGDLLDRDFTAQAPNRVWVTDFERHEALLNRAVVRGHRLRLVAAGRMKLGAA